MGDKPALRPGEAVGSTLAAIAHDIIGEARVAIDDLGRGSPLAVHDYRKAMKRWRAFLRLLEPLVGAEARELRTKARDLAARLGGTRDLQAVVDALSDLESAEPGLSRTSLATMRARIDGASRAAATAAITIDLQIELLAALTTAAQAVDAWLLDISFADVAEGFARHYRRARRAIPAAWQDTEPETLHELRQRVVEHRYHMELVEPLWPRFGKLWVAEAQRLRERLGSHQDLVVLGAATGPHQPLAPWRSRLAPLIEQRKAAHAAGAKRLADRLFAERPGAFRRRLESLWERRGG